MMASTINGQLYSHSDPGLVQLDWAAFETNVLNSTEVWVLEWFTQYCPACRGMAALMKDAGRGMKASGETGIRFGVLDMNLPNVGYAATTLYNIKHIPMVTAYVPGKPKLIYSSGNYEAEPVAQFGQAQFAKLSPEQQAVARAAGRKQLPQAHPDVMYKITNPDTGIAIDTRTNQPWINDPMYAPTPVGSLTSDGEELEDEEL